MWVPEEHIFFIIMCIQSYKSIMNLFMYGVFTDIVEYQRKSLGSCNPASNEETLWALTVFQVSECSIEGFEHFSIFFFDAMTRVDGVSNIEGELGCV